jgi:hypothetical protein
MKDNIKHIGLFNASGCLSRQAIEGLLNSSLDKDALALVNKHLDECEFCRDAVEGAKAYSSASEFNAHVEEVNSFISKNFFKKDKKVRHILLPVVSVAASVAILIGVVIMLHSDKTSKEMVVAKSEKKENRQETLKGETKQQKVMTDSLSTRLSKPKRSEKSAPPLIKEESTIKNRFYSEKDEVVNDIASDDYWVLNDEATEMEEEGFVAAESEQKSKAEPMESIVIADAEKVSSEKQKSPAGMFKKREDGSERATKASVSTGNLYSLSEADRNETGKRYEMTCLTKVDKEPVFTGNKSADFVQYILSELSGSIQISGGTTIEFEIGTSGKVSDPGINSDMDESSKEKILKIVNSSPEWLPAYRHNKPVASRMKISFGK